MTPQDQLRFAIRRLRVSQAELAVRRRYYPYDIRGGEAMVCEALDELWEAQQRMARYELLTSRDSWGWEHRRALTEELFR